MRAKLKIPEHIIHQMTKAVNLKQVDLASSAIMEADPVVHSWIFESKDINAVIKVVDGAGLARKVARLRPLAVMKG